MNRNQSKIAITLAVLLFCVLSTSLANETRNRYALIIGNGEYQTMTRLTNPVNDATDIALELAQYGFAVELVTNASLGEMTRSVNQFMSTIRGTHEVEAALFYYAGHGVQYNGSNYLIPINMDIRASYELLDKALGMDSVVRGLEESQSKFNLIILDACRDNPFSATRGGDRGLSVMTTAKHGSMLVFATSPGDVAQDGVGRNSPFTDALLEAMRLPGVEIRPLITSVQRMVQERTDGRQVPWMNTSYTGEFYFQTVEEQLARSQEQLTGLQAELASLEREIAQREAAIVSARSSEERRRLENEQATSKALEAAKQLETQRIMEMERQAQAILDSDAAQEVLKGEMESRLASQEVALREYANARRAELDALRAEESVGAISLQDRLETIAQYHRSMKEIRTRYEELIRVALADLDALNLLNINAFKAKNPRDPWETATEHAQRIQDGLVLLERENVMAKNVQRNQLTDGLTRELATMSALLETARRELDGMLFEVPMESIRVSVSEFDAERKVFPMQVRVETGFGIFTHPLSFTIASRDRETLKNEYYRVYSADQSGALVGRVTYRAFEESDDLWVLLLEDLEVLSLLEESGVLATLWQENVIRIAAPVMTFSVGDTVQKITDGAVSHNFILSGLPEQGSISIDGVQYPIPTGGGVFKGKVKAFGNTFIEVESPWLSDPISHNFRSLSVPWGTIMHIDASGLGQPVGKLLISRADLDVEVVSMVSGRTVSMQRISSGYSAKLAPGSYTVKAKLSEDPYFVFSTTAVVWAGRETVVNPGQVQLSSQRRYELTMIELEKRYEQAMIELEELRKTKASRTIGKAVGWSAVGVATAGVVGSVVSYLFYNNAVQNYHGASLSDDLLKYRDDAARMGSLFTASIITGVVGGIGGGTILGLDAPKTKALNKRIAEQEALISSLRSQIGATRAREAMGNALERLGVGSISPVIEATLRYSLDGGTMAEATVKSLAIGTRIGTLPTPVKPGYRFEGWWTEPGGKGERIESAMLVFAHDQTIHAKWIALETVRSDENDHSAGMAPSSQTQVQGTTATLQGLDSLARSGFTFEGWNTKPDGTGVRPPEGGSYASEEAGTLYAQWRGNNIALASNGAKATASSEGYYMGIYRRAEAAIDGSSASFWASNGQMPAWLEIEFDRPYLVDTIAIWWGTHRHDFSIILSEDGKTWTAVKGGKSNNFEGSDPVYEIYEIPPRRARLLRVRITSTTAPASHIFQALIHEVEAYGGS